MPTTYFSIWVCQRMTSQLIRSLMSFSKMMGSIYHVHLNFERRNSWQLRVCYVEWVRIDPWNCNCDWACIIFLEVVRPEQLVGECINLRNPISLNKIFADGLDYTYPIQRERSFAWRRTVARNTLPDGSVFGVRLLSTSVCHIQCSTLDLLLLRCFWCHNRVCAHRFGACSAG